MLALLANSSIAQEPGGASVDHPVDMTSRIVNPRFDNNDVTTGWSGTRLYCYETHENAEVYSDTFDVFQKVEGLPKGVYAVGISQVVIWQSPIAILRRMMRLLTLPNSMSTWRDNSARRPSALSMRTTGRSLLAVMEKRA